MTTRARGVALGVALVACLVEVAHTAQAPWQDFEGSWSGSGTRDTLPMEDGRTAAIVRLSGALVLTGCTGLRRGFRMEVIGYDEGSGTGVGRAVWTDDNGDKVFSRTVGSGVEAGRRTMATFTGGTGRYAGVAGSYTVTWQYVLPGEQGVIQARATSLTGRYRLEGSQ